jgi:transposase
MLKDSYYTEPTEIDQLVFDKLIPPEHYLRRVKNTIDFERFRDLLKDCYSPRMGRGAEDPVRLIKLEFLQHHANLSDRDVIAEAQVNIAYRFFLDLSLDSRLPSPGLLSQFRSRLGSERHQVLFDQVVRQAREHGLMHDRLRLKDATHVLGNIAVPTTLRLVAQARQRLLDSARPLWPERVEQEEGEAVRLSQVTADLKEVDRLTARVAHLRSIVAWADALQQELSLSPELPDAVRKRFEAALEVAHRVLADRDEPKRGDQVRSVVDPEARRGKHGDYFDGYLLDISVDPDSELLGAVQVLAGNGDEARNAQSLLTAEEQAQGNDIESLSIDGIGWNGEVLRHLSDPDGLAVEVYVPPQPEPAEAIYFRPQQFVLDEDSGILTCPGDQQTASKTRNNKNTGWKFTFPRSACAQCVLQAQCMASLPQHKGRSVIKNDYQVEYDAARQRATTEAYQTVRRQHPRVERKLADMVRNHGGRRTRYRGRWRVHIHYLMIGMVVNIKRMVKLLSSRQAQTVLQPV